MVGLGPGTPREVGVHCVVVAMAAKGRHVNGGHEVGVALTCVHCATSVSLT